MIEMGGEEEWGKSMQATRLDDDDDEVRMEWLVGWLFGFLDISIFVGYFTLNPLYTNNQFYFK